MKESKEEKRLKALASYDIVDTGEEAQFDALTRLASYICETPVSLISLLEKDRQWFKSKKGVELDETPREISFCHHAIQQDEAVYEVENALKDDLFKENPLVTSDPNIRFYAGAALVDEEGNKLGTLCVLDTIPKKLSQSQREALEVLAVEVMAQIKLRKYQKTLELEIDRQTSELREHVEELEQAKKELDHQKKFLRKVIDTSPNLIYVKNKEGVFQIANRAVANLYRSSTDEVEGKTDFNFNRNKDEVEFFLKKDLEVIDGKRASTPYEEKIITNGRDSWFSTVKVPLEVDHEIHVLGVSTDITEQKDLEKTLKIRNQELEEFLYNASHDLRGPVSSLLGVAELMKKGNDFQSIEEYGQMIFELGTKLDITLHKLLEVRKVVNKELCPQKLNLNSILPQWINERYGDRNVIFDFDFSKGDSLVVDEELLLLVIQKVLNNACAYHTETNTRKEVKIYSGMSTSHFHVWIEDNGFGIEEEHLPKVTQMFYKGTKQSPGSGLGLYVGKKVMEQLNGLISIHSVPFSGTTVELSFPLLKE